MRTRVSMDAIGDTGYTNPVGKQFQFPDPCFWKGDDGYFYIKSSGRTFTVKRTRDFINFEDTGRTFISSSAMDRILEMYITEEYPDNPHFWAPQVIKIGNKWILYLSIIQRNGDTNGQSAIIALTSRTPYGDFSDPTQICISDRKDATEGPYFAPTSKGDAETPVLVTEIIDSFVYCDPDDNRIYMLAGSSDTVRRFSLNDDGLSLRDFSTVHVAGQKTSVHPERDTVCEGAYLYSRTFNGRTFYYLFCSTGFYNKPNYRVVVGRSTKASGTTRKDYPYAVYFMNKLDSVSKNMRVGDFEVVLSTNPNNLGAGKVETDDEGFVIKNDEGLFWGPGHIGGIIETSNGRTFMLFHCHNGIGEGDRRLFIQEIGWGSNGWPYALGNNGNFTSYPTEMGELSFQVITETTEIL